MDKEKFTGAWKLISTDYQTEDGEVIYPFGEEVIGLLMYDGKRSMAAQVIKANRPDFASGDWLKGTPEELKSAFEGFRSYFGTYDVRGDRVVHHIEVSFFPNWIGVDQDRVFEFDGNRLLLSTPPTLVQGTLRTAHLIWERT